jgi:flagellar hook-basal body complex protein FliE
MYIQSITPGSPSLPGPVSPAAAPSPASAFSSLLEETMGAEAGAQRMIESALLGEDVTEAEVMAAVKKADLSVRMLMQIRNKVVNAYNEIQQMRF